MKNGQPDSQGQRLLDNMMSMDAISEDEEQMSQRASTIADMMKSPEMKFFRKFPKKNQEEVITIEDSDEDPVVIKDSDEKNEDCMHEEATKKTEHSVTQVKGVFHFDNNQGFTNTCL